VVNNQRKSLSELPTQGRVQVVPCSSAQVDDFIDVMDQQQQAHIQTYGGHG